MLPSRSAGIKTGIALQLPWLARSEIAREVKSELETSAQVSRSAREHLTALKRVCGLIRIHELTPVLVIDDSDRWLQRGEPRPDIVGVFFGRVVRELARLDLGFTIAVHERHLALREYRDNTVGIQVVEGASATWSPSSHH